MTAPRHIAVIGAGIVGVSTAIWLQRDGHSVTLIDRAGPAEGTSYGNGGVLASCSIVPVTGPRLIRRSPRMLFDPREALFLRWGYLPRLMPWLARYLSHANLADTERISAAMAPIVGDSLDQHQALAAGTGAERWVVPSDYVFLYRDRAGYEKDALAWRIRREHGFDWQEIEGEALRRRDPVFSDAFGFAACLGGHGRIADPGQYVKDLAAHFERAGGRFLRADVSDFVQEGGRLTGLRLGPETLHCDAAVVATGVWSGPLARKLGLKVPLESERGYHVELWEPSVMPRDPVMVAAGKFVVTPMEGRIRLAGILEFGGLKAGPSRAPLAFIRRHIARALPGLSWKHQTDWMGHRPAPADSIPVIGAVPGMAGVHTGFGHHHVGLTGGPKTGRLLAQIVSGRTPNIDMAPYSPARFQAGG